MGCGASVKPGQKEFDQPAQSDMEEIEEDTPQFDIIVSVCEPEPAIDECSPFNPQNYDRLMKWCDQTGQKFVDPEFFPQDKSVFLEKRPKSDIAWLRPKEICKDPRLYLEGASTCDFEESNGNQSPFMIACSFLASYPQLITRLIPDLGKGEWHPNPKYNGILRFILYNRGEWTDLVIDDYLPTRQGKLIFCPRTSRKEFWAPLLEKAYAKLLGNYEHLSSRSVTDMIEDLTGVYSETYKIPGSLRDWKTAYSVRQLYVELLNAHKQDSLIYMHISKEISCKGTGGRAFTFEQGSMILINLVQWIPFEGILPESDDPVIPMIRLYNPHGHTEQTGPWLFHEEEWNSMDMDTRDTIGMFLENDGEFWIKFEDLPTLCMSVTIFRSIGEDDDQLTCLQYKGKVRALETSPVSDCWGDPQFLLEVERDGTDIALSFDLQGENSQAASAGTSIAIYEGTHSKGFRVNAKAMEPIVRKMEKKVLRCILRTTLKKGRYLVVTNREIISGAALDLAFKYLFRLKADDEVILSSELQDNRSVTQIIDDPLLSDLDNLTSDLIALRKSRRLVDINVCVHFCEGLDIEGYDPLELYCMVVAGEESYGSSVYEDGMNPVWDFSAVFYDIDMKILSTFLIEVRNRAKNDELIGMALIKDIDKGDGFSYGKRKINQVELQASKTDSTLVSGLLYYSISSQRS